MKLIRNSIAASFAFAALAVAACSSQQGSTGGAGNGGEIGSLGQAHGSTGSVGMRLTVPPGVHVNALSWIITNNGPNTYTGTVNITDDAGNEAQSIEFVAGDIVAGSYTITLSGTDSNGDPCTSTAVPVTVVAGATTAAVVIVTCTVPTDGATGTTVNTGNVAIDAGVVLVNGQAFVCPAVGGVSVSPAEVLPPQTAGLVGVSTGGSGGTTTLLWTAPSGGTIDNATSANATFHCPGVGVFPVTLTVGLLGGTPGVQVCTGIAGTTTTENIVCEAGGSVPDASVADATPDVVTVLDATPDVVTVPDSSGGGAPTACTTAPCAASGPNSVQCFQSPTGDGVCTATEALIVARDIAQGNTTAAGQLKPFVSAANSGSCYTCLNANSCLDDNQQDVGNECSDAADLSGGAAGSGVDQCISTLGCILGSDCQGAGGITGTSATAAQENVQLCYCGGNNAGSACSTAGAATNGLCVNQEAAGFGFVFSDNKDILAHYGDQTLPSGIANAVYQCAAANHCALCQ